MFTLSILCAQLATEEHRRIYEEAGILSHIARIGIGMEDVDLIWDTLLKLSKWLR